MAKPFARQFYSSKQWQECRNAYAERVHHLCEDCLARGIYKPGEIVHHTIEITPLNIETPEITLNPDNLEMLCRECHLQKHDIKGGRWAAVNAKKRNEKASRQRYVVDPDGKVTAKAPHSGENGAAL